MEYTTRIKRIGGSAYLLLPPKLARNYGFKDNSEILLQESDRRIVMDTRTKKIDKAGGEILAAMKKGLDLDYRITREELYETDRH